MEVTMDAMDDLVCLSSFLADDDDDDGVMLENARSDANPGNNRGNEKEDEPDETFQSNQGVSFSDGSSSRELRLSDGEDQEGHQKNDEDADDELSDDNPTDEASASDSASLGTTATSSGDTEHGGKPSAGWDMLGAKGCWNSCCFLSFGRFLCFWLLVAGTVIVGKEVAQYASQREAEQMEEEFYEFASQLILTAQHRHQAVLDALNTMSLTTVTVSAGQTWPFVTLPDFDLWTNRFSIGARTITLVVMADQDQREEWNEFSRTNSSSWMVGHLAPSDDITPYVWKKKEQESAHCATVSAVNEEQIIEDLWVGKAAIAWQSTTPIDPRAINFNQRSSSALGPAIDRLYEEYTTNSPIQWSTAAIPSSTFLLQPIAPSGNDLLGYLMAQISWVSYLQGGAEFDTLSAQGLVLIVHDGCAGHATELDLYHGRDARLVDSERVSNLVSSSLFMLESPLVLSRRQQVNDNKEDNRCASPIVLQVFATDAFAGLNGSAALRTEPPKLAIATGIFVVMLGMICFLLYHFWTRRQQAELAKSAKKTLAIVNSLFPANVRDRLLEKEDNNSLPHARSIGGLKRASTGGKTGKKKLGQQSSNKIQHRFTTVFQSMAESMALAHDSSADDLSASGTPLRVSKSFTSTLRRRLASKPIADLFPQVTVLFADIAGFTSWSSVREPSQVFTLLESIFETFDGIAKRHKVFKVETIGDCYVAAAGLPDRCDEHAIVMCNFARKALQRMGSVVQALDAYLGPGTSELSMRIGLHSGPIMAGVLRGEKTRFQLFGDTMNTASRIESSGEKNRIHISKQTANLLIAAGKESWVQARDELVTAKGKGQLQTYWLTVSQKSSSTIASSGNGGSVVPTPLLDAANRHSSIPAGLLVTMSSIRRGMTMPENSVQSGTVGSAGAAAVSSPSKQDQMKRLVDYNTQVLERYLKKMVAMRQEKAMYSPFSNEDDVSLALVPAGMSTVGSIFDEVRESIALPTKPAKYLQDPDQVVLSSLVQRQLRDFVRTIASMYRDVPFHSFDHASHVVMSVTKLMARVVTPETIDYKDMSYKIKAASSALHQYTYGITSDPLTQFAVSLAALVHDVDHSGVPNAQLVKEEDEIAVTYSNKSVAEQHSIYLAWDLLMEDQFKELRGCIYTSQAELDRFRALLVNAIMATDIADKDLSGLRRRRWEKVFGMDDQVALVEDQDSTNRKATIVIEHLIQASDVAHTMQHWHVFLRWNKRLFKECYHAYQSGRGDKDPLESWYQGELGFFDFYIIPLAKKLQECGVFGVASDEYLQYAVANRTEWEEKGREIVEEYRAEVAAPMRRSSITFTGSNKAG